MWKCDSLEIRPSDGLSLRSRTLQVGWRQYYCSSGGEASAKKSSQDIYNAHHKWWWTLTSMLLLQTVPTTAYAASEGLYMVVTFWNYWSDDHGHLLSKQWDFKFKRSRGFVTTAGNTLWAVNETAKLAGWNRQPATRLREPVKNY